MNINKRNGFTLIEILVTVGISAVVMTAAFGTINNVVLLQKKILVTQNFYRETQLVLQQMNAIIKEHAIDYDKYFITKTYSPHNGTTVICQTPTSPTPDSNLENYNNEILPYPDQFFFANASSDGETRTYGGQKPSGGLLLVEDPCASAWDASLTINDLYLIEPDNTDISPVYGYVVKREDDANGVGRVALYLSEVIRNEALQTLVISTDRLVGNISHPSLNITNIEFEPWPNADPNLAFALDDKQIHPYIRVSITAELADPERYGFTLTAKPTIKLSSLVSSRSYDQPHITFD